MMSLFARSFLFALLCFSGLEIHGEETFLIVAHNVENLFDGDDVSMYEDYKKEFYGKKELNNKLDALVRTLKKIGGKTGPEILLLQEIEVDRTPVKFPSATELLLNKLKEEGLGPYYYAQGYNPNDPEDQWPSVQCLTLSKFPIKEIHLHPLQNARPVLETKIIVKGNPLILFNCHWKSGASSKEMEVHRLHNARTLRNRIDTLIKEDAFLDFLVGGDLNSHYNQSMVYREEMKTTGINDILLSGNIEPTGNEIGRNLYNLWHELPISQRGSDAWRGNWGTLMHLVLPQGLYDAKGVRYVTDSFGVGVYEGINAIHGSKLPLKWTNDLDGFGCSDHFPVFAKFRTTGEKPKNGESFPEIERTARPVDYFKAVKKAALWNPESLIPSNYGRTFQFIGKISSNNPLTLESAGHRLGLYSFTPKVRNKLFSMVKGEEVSGFGHLSRYRGQWQLIVEKEDWIK